MINYDKALFIHKPKSTPFIISDDGDDDEQEEVEVEVEAEAEAEEEEDDCENREEGANEFEDNDYSDDDEVCYFFVSEFVLIEVLR